MNKYIKYPNRKIYSRETHSYVTLNDIIYDVQRGMPVLITDFKTKNDVTAAVLGQCIANMTIPSEQLVTLIRGLHQ